jgi:regulator of sigma E protease
MLLGISFAQQHVSVGPLNAVSLSGNYVWQVASGTVSTLAKVFQSKERRQLHSVVGIYSYTAQSFSQGPSVALEFLALISLALAIINLFPLLPLDGGHIFWALVEKVRGRRVPLAVMERASLVGVVLIVMLVAVGLSNDLSALFGKGLVLPK